MGDTKGKTGWGKPRPAPSFPRADRLVSTTAIRATPTRTQAGSTLATAHGSAWPRGHRAPLRLARCLGEIVTWITRPASTQWEARSRAMADHEANALGGDGRTVLR
jgi:hypothetical protein